MAVTALTGAESQRERIINAYASLIGLKHKGLPPETHAAFDVLMKGLLGITPNSLHQTQHAAREKVNLLDDAEVIKMISLIIDIHCLTTRYHVSAVEPTSSLKRIADNIEALQLKYRLLKEREKCRQLPGQTAGVHLTGVTKATTNTGYPSTVQR
jgi:hypothetical protein